MPDYSKVVEVEYKDDNNEFAPSHRGNIHTIIDGYPTTADFINNDSEEVQNAKIKVEQMQASILLLSGDDDLNWPSAEYSKQIMDRLDLHRYPNFYQHVCYSKTGHLIEPPYAPICRLSFHKLVRGSMLWGGTAAYQNKAQVLRKKTSIFTTIFFN